MTGRSGTERILDAYLAPDADRLADRVIEAALADIARIPQRRALRVPWRFPLMTNTMRAAAGIAIVAIVGVGILAFNSRSPGFGATDSPAPTSTPSPAPSEVAQGITGWTTYTSDIYGITIGYPDDWTLYAKATRKWRPGDGFGGEFANQDVFTNPANRDGDEIAFGLLQIPAGPDDDITSREGLAAWVEANHCDEAIDACETVPEVAMPMCLGRVACLPAILVPLSDGTGAYLADTETGQITVVSIFRQDSFPAAARYGGSVQLLKSILTTMDVWTPEPGQIPSGG